AANEAASSISVVVLERGDRGAALPLPALELFVEEAGCDAEGVEHEAAPDEAGAICQPIGEALARRCEQQTGGTDGVGGAEHDIRGLEPLGSVLIDPLDTASQSVMVEHDAARTRSGDHSTAALEDARPVCEIGRCLRALTATGCAGAP